ncbi:hypothetical protein TorRG33x02_355440 [Trema orientale]|uniref:Uncharacterized protein n=1 Tax=Trema orientale TaxID=63057 RepID=A0A2P5A9G3_TREOI|nr:hypothetical protein TorRG33x02_355440 [Trema orientale]
MAFICWQKKDKIPQCATLLRKSENIVCKEAFVSGLDDIVNLREDNDDMHHRGKDDTNDDDGSSGGGDDDDDDKEEDDDDDDNDDEEEEENNDNNNKNNDEVALLIEPDIGNIKQEFPYNGNIWCLYK